MGYLVHATDIVAYTFTADTYCPDCIVGQIDGQMYVSGSEAEAKLDYLATMLGIDRYDEYSYDSGDFPKVVFASQVEDIEHCGSCDVEI